MTAPVLAILTGCAVEGTPAAAPPAIRTTVTQTVEATGPSRACIDALYAAEQAASLSADAIDIMSEAFDAAVAQQTDRIEDLTADLEKLTPKIEAAAAKYNRQAETCRSGG